MRGLSQTEKNTFCGAKKTYPKLDRWYLSRIVLAYSKLSFWHFWWFRARPASEQLHHYRQSLACERASVDSAEHSLERIRHFESCSRPFLPKSTILGYLTPTECFPFPFFSPVDFSVTVSSTKKRLTRRYGEILRSLRGCYQIFSQMLVSGDLEPHFLNLLPRGNTHSVGVKGVVDKVFNAVEIFHAHIRTQWGRFSRKIS